MMQYLTVAKRSNGGLRRVLEVTDETGTWYIVTVNSIEVRAMTKGDFDMGFEILAQEDNTQWEPRKSKNTDEKWSDGKTD